MCVRHEFLLLFRTLCMLKWDGVSDTHWWPVVKVLWRDRQPVPVRYILRYSRSKDGHRARGNRPSDLRPPGVRYCGEIGSGCLFATCTYIHVLQTGR